ncbi:uncharacterized protein LOC128890802 isoform X1 [Hylaeus anthracinus]|uniref:uncharacterized protein LOC128890802 isoform X1 n=1 Tax=Hylaeus anthracinus TaxID=313031 RepID=UPI0023B89CF0|nr:uncharacterized protein LOC128890802 isoform X1 [Hylaeus anthracinus]
MYYCLTIYLLVIGWCNAATISTGQEIRTEQNRQKEESNDQAIANPQTGSQQLQTYVSSQGNHLSPNQYFYPTYTDYNNGGYAMKTGYEGYLIPAVLSPQRESHWTTEIATTLLPFSGDVLLYAARAGAYLLHLVFTVIMGSFFTTVVCTFTSICSISFLGYGLNKNQVKEQVAELARTYVTPESINAATILVSRAIESYTAMQREKQETAKQQRSTRASSWVVIAFIAIITTGCKSDVVQASMGPNRVNNTIPTIPIRDDDDELEDFVPYQGERFNVFDWLLLRALSKRNSGNVLVSPISLKIAMVLLYEGAQDETANELATVMQLPATRTATREKFSTILRSFMESSPAYKLNIGTRMYVDSSILTRQRYEAILKTFYTTDVLTANFSVAPLLVESINAWVANITEGNIDKMIEHDSSIKNSVMVIMNALFFKGSWRRKYFDPTNTQVRPFYTSGNRTLNVPYMRVVGRFYYSESSELEAKILRIPYDGHKFAMYLVLPRARDGIEKLVSLINPYALTRHVWLMQDLPIDVSIPKFKYQFTSHLESVLRELGIRDIFDDTATLTGIARTKKTSRHLKVSDILQKTGIEVNENGTTAYAATEVDLVNKMGEETFYADHPFIFYIEDESTGTILYMGKMVDPLDVSGNANSSLPQFPSKFGPGIPDADTILQAGLNAEDRNNLFNTYLSQALNKEYNGNLVSSPASLKMALTMLAEGASGDTETEIVSSLRLPEKASDTREITQRVLKALKRAENGTEISLSTCMWIDRTLNVLDSYERILQSNYDGYIQSVDFTDTQNTVNAINHWINQATRNKITSLSVNSVQPETRLLLTSVIYFKGRWLKSFDKANTNLHCFYTPTGECRKINFMVHESTYRYAQISSIDAEVLELPYSDGKTSMLILMPSKKERDPYLRILSKDLSTVPVSAMLASLKERGVTLYLPKFTIENSLNLVPTLQHLGIDRIFNSNANLTKIVSNGPLQVTSIVQNVQIEVDEEGTLAVADTEIGFVPLSSWNNDIKFNRPFLFIIIDSVTHTTLFSGRFIQPV